MPNANWTTPEHTDIAALRLVHAVVRRKMWLARYWHLVSQVGNTCLWIMSLLLRVSHRCLGMSSPRRCPRRGMRAEGKLSRWVHAGSLNICASGKCPGIYESTHKTSGRRLCVLEYHSTGAAASSSPDSRFRLALFCVDLRVFDQCGLGQGVLREVILVQNILSTARLAVKHDILYQQLWWFLLVNLLRSFGLQNAETPDWPTWIQIFVLEMSIKSD